MTARVKYKNLEINRATFVQSKFEIICCYKAYYYVWELVQGGPERSRQSNLAVFAVEGGLDSKFLNVK